MNSKIGGKNEQQRHFTLDKVDGKEVDIGTVSIS